MRAAWQTHVREEKMNYLANVMRSGMGYLVLWSPADSVAGPGLPKGPFKNFEELTSYLSRATNFEKSYEQTLRLKLEQEHSHPMELEPMPGEIQEWDRLTSVKSQTK
jgi:hypothetical protein